MISEETSKGEKASENTDRQGVERTKRHKASQPTNSNQTVSHYFIFISGFE